MEQQDIKTLKILEAFHKDPCQTQRDLSKKLQISLGMVNAFTKRLAKKGYFKATTIPKKRIQYILTPKGLSEKARLTYQYILYSMQYYRDTRAKLRAIFKNLSKINSAKIYFFGISELAEIAYIALQETDHVLAGIIDDKAAVQDFMGVPVIGALQLENISLTDWIVITKLDEHEEIIEVLKKNGFDGEKIIDLRN